MEFKYEGNSLKGGIYKITNLKNGRVYFGSCKGFKQRWSQHKLSLENNRHSNKFLQADFNKCGPEVFVFEILEVIDGPKEKRLFREEVYLREHFDGGKQCYNLCDRAISRAEAPDRKQRKVAPPISEETRRKHSNRAKRVWQSPEHRQKVSEKCSEKAKKQWQDPEIAARMVKRMTEVAKVRVFRNQYSNRTRDIP